MQISTAIAIYFLVWWITLFAVLPFGVRSQHEGEMVAGTDPGAPILPRLVSKLVWTTAISALVFAAIYLATYYQLIGLDDIPGLPRPTL